MLLRRHDRSANAGMPTRQLPRLAERRSLVTVDRRGVARLQTATAQPAVGGKPPESLWPFSAGRCWKPTAHVLRPGRAAAGGRVVLDATEGGQRTMPRRFDPARVASDPLQELADAYFDGIPDAFRRPNSRLYEWLGRELAARHVQGIIFRRYLWCDLWHAELQRLKQWSPAARPGNRRRPRRHQRRPARR